MTRRIAASVIAAACGVALTGVAPAGARTPPHPPPRPCRCSAAALYAPATHQLLYGVNAQRRVAIASTTKLMTALVVLQHVHRLSTMFTQNDYTSAAVDSQIGLAPGERMSVHDLLLALMLPSADDAAEDLAFNVGHGSVARFVGMMNAEARMLGLRHTHYTTPIGLDTPGQLLERRGPGQARRLRHDPQPLLRAHRRAAAGHAVLRQPRAHGGQPQRPGGPVPVDRRHQDGPHARCRLRPGRLGAQRGDGADQCRPRDRLRDIARRQHPGAARVRRRQLPRLDARAARASCMARPTVKEQPSLHPTVTAAAGYSRILPRSARVRVSVAVPHQLIGPLPGPVGGGHGHGHRRQAGAGAHPAACSTSVCPRSAGSRRAARFVTQPLTLLVIAGVAGGAALLVRNVRRRRRIDRRGRELEAT